MVSDCTHCSFFSCALFRSASVHNVWVFRRTLLPIHRHQDKLLLPVSNWNILKLPILKMVWHGSANNSIWDYLKIFISYSNEDYSEGLTWRIYTWIYIHIQQTPYTTPGIDRSEEFSKIINIAEYQSEESIDTFANPTCYGIEHECKAYGHITQYLLTKRQQDIHM